MKFNVNLIIQTLGTAVQVLNAITPVFPNFKIEIAALVAVAQSVTSVIAHQYNTDGTPQSEPKLPPPTV